ncbi:TlpA family protein disulfide reductase [Kineococcus gynurae]|uniref:TlpA family protein disulfide reductase n=1 Tax=Kineococcus gynurae TaxID=452979 RepID=A0ABV5LTN5_9ACTN
MRRRAALAAGAVLLLSGCTAATGGTGLPEATSGQNYIDGDGSIVTTPAGKRTEPVEVSGTGVDGETIDTADLRGKVVVLNTWFADCGPCRAEAEDLEQVWQEYRERGVQFVGINTYDSADRAKAFQRRFGTTYPSILDADSGAAMLALRGVAPNATPTTIVLDTEGRVAARVSGIVTPITLSDLLDDAGATPAAGTGA